MDIEQFEPKAFYTLKARFSVPNGQYDGQWFTEGPEGTISRFDSKARRADFEQDSRTTGADHSLLIEGS